ncbi:hypothetical protein [Wolbachia endosymbiont of Pentidionis agamae]|uniref:hypothetical protein n=1 Tax=Wolbachia endosymbiont of Pentidionis agamae TaxID=3110435 RepID=UPI002FD77DD5
MQINKPINPPLAAVPENINNIALNIKDSTLSIGINVDSDITTRYKYTAVKLAQYKAQIPYKKALT